MNTKPKVDYLASARRHIKDAHILLHQDRKSNAGQLFGFSVECGLKALMVGSGAAVDPDGNILKASGLREHMPKLGQMVNNMSTLPDGRAASILQSQLPHLSDMHDWHTDHRYWRASAVPTASSLAKWEMAALEMDTLLDDATSKGLL